MASGRNVPCPHCGEPFREGRVSCPHCGADAETGWLSEEDQDLAAMDLNFTHLEAGEYDLFLQSEGFEAPDPDRPRPSLSVTTVPIMALILWGLSVAIGLLALAL